MPKPLARRRAQRQAVLALILLGGACACASLDGAKVPGCQGARRPANPYGSVLSPDVPPVSAAAAPAGPCAGSKP